METLINFDFRYPTTLDELRERISCTSLLCSQEIVNPQMKTIAQRWQVIETDACRCEYLNEQAMVLSLRLRNGQEVNFYEYHSSPQRFIEQYCDLLLPVHQLVGLWYKCQSLMPLWEKLRPADLPYAQILTRATSGATHTQAIDQAEKQAWLNLTERLREAILSL